MTAEALEGDSAAASVGEAIVAFPATASGAKVMTFLPGRVAVAVAEVVVETVGKAEITTPELLRIGVVWCGRC